MADLGRSAGAQAGGAIGRTIVPVNDPEPTGGRNSLAWRLWADKAPMSKNVEYRPNANDKPSWQERLGHAIGRGDKWR